MLDYQVGDTVIHHEYGLGEIIQMDEKFIHERQTLCYVVHTFNQITIWVTADDPENSSIRRPTPESTFETLFDILRSPGTLLPIDRLERKMQLSERMKEGDLASICSVICDLMRYRREKKWNENDKSIMERAQSFLIAEWMYSLSVTKANANTKLTQLLGNV
jgi:RNA polymerase-interacting CarD/CdnL/TRCF family regulator